MYQKISEELPETVLAFMPFICIHGKEHDFNYFWFAEVVGGVRGCGPRRS